MRVNKPYFDYFLKENTLFRNGKSNEELLRNTTIVSNTENRASWPNCGFINVTNKRADGFNFLAVDFLGMFVGVVYMEGGRSYTSLFHSII